MVLILNHPNKDNQIRKTYYPSRRVDGRTFYARFVSKQFSWICFPTIFDAESIQGLAGALLMLEAGKANPEYQSNNKRNICTEREAPQAVTNDRAFLYTNTIQVTRSTCPYRAYRDSSSNQD